MSTVEKRYWEWQDRFYYGELRLGMSVQDAFNAGLLRTREGSLEVMANDVWKVDVTGDSITGIHYQQTFFSMIRDDLWELELSVFESVLRTQMKPVKSDYEGDKLRVVFRDHFVAVASLLAR